MSIIEPILRGEEEEKEREEEKVISKFLFKSHPLNIIIIEESGSEGLSKISYLSHHFR